MAKKPPVHVVAREDGWAVVREGNDRATSVLPTQAEAARKGRDIARRHETGFLLHGKDGRIRERNDYGSGQHPREGASTGPAMEDFAPGTQTLGETTTNAEGQTVQRTTDRQGDIVDTAFDEEGKVVDESPVGSVADLPGAEGYGETTDEEGITKRVVKDDSGTLIEVQIGPDGSVLDLQIPPGTEKVEETAQQVGQATQGAQDGAEQATEQAESTTGQAAGQAQDDAGGATRQARDTAGQATDGDQGPAGQTAGQKAPGGQDTAAQTARQGNGGRQRKGEQAEGQGPNATPAARRKAEELGVDLSRVEGTGSNGRITVDDVKQPAATTEDGAREKPEASEAAERRAEELGINLSQIKGSGSGGRVIVRDVTNTAGGAQERATGGDQRQGEDREAEEQGREAEGGAEDAVGQAAGQTARESQDTVGQAAGQARNAAGGAAQQDRDTARQATRRDDREASQGGAQQQGGGGQELDATDATGRKAEEAGVNPTGVEGSGARERITVDDVNDPSGQARGGTAGEQRTAQGARDAAGHAAEGAGGATRSATDAADGPAFGDTDRSAGRSVNAATDGATDVARSGVSDGRTDDAAEARGMIGEGSGDDRFEMVGEGYANYEVYDQDGERIGRADHLFLAEDDRLEYIGVETDIPDSRAVLVPAEVIPAGNERRRMVVSRPKSLVERGPTFGDRGDVTPALEERVRSHYGLPSRPGAGDRSDPDAPITEERSEGERGAAGATGPGIRVADTESGEFREHDRNVEGVGQPGSDLKDEDELRVQRSEEELRVGTREREAGSVNVSKSVRTDRERMEVPTRREEVSVERVPVEGEATEAQIGEDEVSVPVVEEEAVVEKRPVAKEEIRIRKDVVEDIETVEEDVRREEIEVADRTERRTR